LEKLSLKPHQKAQLTSKYSVPHFLYNIALAIPPISTLRRLDGMIRDTVKKIFHLPICTANGLICCAKRDGEWECQK
jgi:hypothetical protein